LLLLIVVALLDVGGAARGWFGSSSPALPLSQLLSVVSTGRNKERNNQSLFTAALFVAFVCGLESVFTGVLSFPRNQCRLTDDLMN
jgi:hypothetical protein